MRFWSAETGMFQTSNCCWGSKLCSRKYWHSQSSSKCICSPFP